MLLIVVTLVCAYLACWVATKTRGIGDVKNCVESSYFPDAAAAHSATGC